MAFIKKSPGTRIEEIKRRLGRSTGEPSGPLTKLITGKKVRRRGVKRAPRYFPTGR